MDLSCLICGDILKLRRKNVFFTSSDHSHTILYELIEKVLDLELDLQCFKTEEEKETLCLCESCFGKVNNYDLGMSICTKARKELEQLLEEKIVKQENESAAAEEYKDVEVKLETQNENVSEQEFLESYTPEIENIDEEMEEEHLLEFEDENNEFLEHNEIHNDSDSLEAKSEVPVQKTKTRKIKGWRQFLSRRLYCSICKAGYLTQEELNQHVEKHNGLGPNQCTDCHKVFAQKGALSRHMPMHTGEKPYQCAKCQKRFIHYSSYNMHMLIHDDVREKKCEICGLALRSTSHLTRHMRTHSGEKPFACPTCGQKFAQRYNMNSHMKSHQGIKRSANKTHNCPLCEMTFKIQPKLTEHLKNVHGQTIAVVEPCIEDKGENGEGWIVIQEEVSSKLNNESRVKEAVSSIS